MNIIERVWEGLGEVKPIQREANIVADFKRWVSTVLHSKSTLESRRMSVECKFAR